MRAVRSGVDHRRASRFVPAPYQCGIAFEGMRSCEFGSIEALPETALLVAEGRNPAFRGNAGAGKADDTTARAQHAEKAWVNGRHGEPRIMEPPRSCAGSYVRVPPSPVSSSGLAESS